MLFLLGSDPELQEKLFESIKNLSSKEILRDSLIKGVIKETLRLYPIAPFITRYLPEDNVIGGYFVPKGVHKSFFSYLFYFIIICVTFIIINDVYFM